MSDHEFEKQVRQKLDDLRLTPTPAAWQKIEEGIRDTRRRRAPLLWLPLLLIGLAAGGYFLHKSSPNAVILGEAKEQRSKTNPPADDEQPGVNPREANEERSKTALPADDDQPEVNPREANEERSKTDPADDKGAVVLSELKEQRSRADSPLGDVTRTVTPSDANEQRSNAGLPSGNDKDPLVPIEANNLYKKSAITLNPIKPAFASPNGPKLTAASLAASPSPAPPRLIKKSKWSYGIVVFGGISGLNNGNLLGVKSAFNSDVQSPVNAAFAPSYTPYRIVAGPAYSAGVFVKREISKRFDVSAGLNYAQLNVKYRPGAQVYISPLNSAPPPPLNAGNFFRLDQHKARDYRNTYQFIELPVTLHTRITKSQRLPVYWNTGVSYTRLVATNSKHFDGTTGLYYSNENQINKNQVAVSTGFDFVVTPKSKYPITVGPSVRYNLTPLTNEKFADKRNLLSAGVNVKLGLRK
jgi:hypothetical protein